MPPLTDHDRARIRELAAEGLTVAEIARAIGFPHNQVHAYCRDYGIERRKGRPGFASRFTPEHLNEWAARYLAGEPVPAIADAFGCTTSRVYDELAKRGLTPRSKAKLATTSPTETTAP